MSQPLRKLLFALAWMTLPFLSSFGVMKLLATSSDAAQRLAFSLLLFVCAAGQFLALALLNAAQVPNSEWKLLIYSFKIVAFVCLVSFTAYALIAAYFFIRTRPL